jgi:hypothetical protein
MSSHKLCVLKEESLTPLWLVFVRQSCVENGALHFAHINTYTLFRLACIDMQDLFSLSSSSTLLLYIYILCTFNV